MKPLSLLTSLLSLTLLTTGCGEKFVDLAPPTTLPSAQFYKTEADIRTALTGIYGTLRTRYDTYWASHELPSDNTETWPESEAAWGEFDKLTWRPTTGNLTGQWTGHYATIANANILLEKIDAVQMDATLKVRYAAEAKFIRALMYFNLARMFGDAPIILNEVKTEAESYTYLRKPVAEVWAQVEKDLTEAEAVLPARYTAAADLGRVTAGAAKALLGKTLLTQKKWAAAEAKLREVVALNVYQLLPVYANVFSVSNQNNAEIVFAVQYARTGTQEGSYWSVQFLPQASGNQLVATGLPNSLNLGTTDLWNAFETGDLRKATAIAEFKVGTTTYYYTRKFMDTPPGPNEGENDWPVLRYPDVVLMLAEAQNAQGKTAEALTNLNLVRVRAGLPARTGLTQETTQLAIEQERRVELCFEGHRWPDLIRYGKAVSIMTAYKTRYNVAAMSVASERVLYPIPFRERQINPQITQNPGY